MSIQYDKVVRVKVGDMAYADTSWDRANTYAMAGMSDFPKWLTYTPVIESTMGGFYDAGGTFSGIAKLERLTQIPGDFYNVRPRITFRRIGNGYPITSAGWGPYSITFILCNSAGEDILIDGSNKDGSVTTFVSNGGGTSGGTNGGTAVPVESAGATMTGAATGTVGVPFSFTLPIAISVTDRPSWLTYDSGQKKVSGTPTAAGTYTFGGKTASGFYKLTITIAAVPAASKTLLTWFQASSEALAGARIARASWADRWVEYSQCLWWLQLYNPTTKVLGARTVIQATEWNEANFRATDWTVDGIPGQIASAGAAHSGVLSTLVFPK